MFTEHLFAAVPVLSVLLVNENVHSIELMTDITLVMGHSALCRYTYSVVQKSESTSENSFYFNYLMQQFS